jgi:hypothetical protein
MGTIDMEHSTSSDVVWLSVMAAMIGPPKLR